MATIKVKQVKSRIKCPKDQKRTLDALGLRKMNQRKNRLNRKQNQLKRKNLLLFKKIPAHKSRKKQREQPKRNSVRMISGVCAPEIFRRTTWKIELLFEN